ncbi:MAG: hypothetical protein ACRDY0_06840 [Acidimicrobiales bacterium]
MAPIPAGEQPGAGRLTAAHLDDGAVGRPQESGRRLRRRPDVGRGQGAGDLLAHDEQRVEAVEQGQGDLVPGPTRVGGPSRRPEERQLPAGGGHVVPRP